MAGPIVGAVVGIMNNLIYGLTVDPISTVYALTNAALGIAVSLLAYYGSMKNIRVPYLQELLLDLQQSWYQRH